MFAYLKRAPGAGRRPATGKTLPRLTTAGAALTLAAAILSVTRASAPAAAVTLPIVSAGGGNSCALMGDQTVWCWGQNTSGQLGDGTIKDAMVPVQVTGLPPALDVAPGHDHTCAIDTTNQVWCWGSNAFGELGNGTTSVDSTAPVSAGDGFSCAVTAVHTARCWGDNNFGELGDGTTNDSSTPKLVKGLTGVVSVAAGYFHACALLSTGRVWCWGDNDIGQLGIGNFTDAHVPAQVASLNSGVQQVGLGLDFGCALANTPAPSVVCWGDADGYGQLGDGIFSEQDPFPTLAFGLQTPPAGGTGGPAQIAVGGHHA